MNLQIPLGLQCPAQAFDVETLEFRRQQLELDALRDERCERPAVDLRHLGLGGLGNAPLAVVDIDAEKGQCLGAKFVEQESGRDVGVVGFHFDQRARRDEEARGDVLGGDAVVHVGQRFVDDAFGIHVLETLAGFHDQRTDAGHVQRQAAAVGSNHIDTGRRYRLVGRLGVGGADAGTLLPIENVVARHLVLAFPHERQLDQVLDLLDVDGAAGGHAAPIGARDLLSQFRHEFPNREDAAAVPPSTARNALVSATWILSSS